MLDLSWLLRLLNSVKQVPKGAHALVFCTSAARRGVNPQSRQPMEVPAKERVRFSPGKELSEAVIKK